MPPTSPTASAMVEGELVGGRYRLLHRIGAGAMGTVWAARHELLGRDFAIKFARLPRAAEGDARRRFLEEAQIAGKLRHPNIVDVADFGETAEGQGLYLAMELLAGESLAEHISAHGPLQAAEAVAIAIEICRGLEAAHAIGVVHRDIKPENIFLARGSSGGIVPKLLDFGISKKASPDDPLATHSGQPFGTPAYMSPEQAVGETDIDRASDIWAMGVVLYEMLLGRHPFVAPSYPALMARIADDPPAPVPEDVPAPVRRVIERCLEKRRGDRYSDAGALREALAVALASITESCRGKLRIESLRVLSSAARDLSGHALAVRSLPARPAAGRMRWVMLGAAAISSIAAFGWIWSKLLRPAGHPSTDVAGAAATAPLEAKPAAARTEPPVTTSDPPSSPLAAASSAAPANSVRLPAASKSPQKPPSRATKVDGPGF